MATGDKSRNIRLVEVISNIPEQIEQIKSFAREFDEFYYIIHDKDLDKDGSLKKKHIHCVVYDRAGTTLKAWINRWSDIVPSNFVEAKKYKPSAIRYLTHESYQAIKDGKIKYDRSQVITNNRDKYLSYFNDESVPIPERLNDYLKLKDGKISISEFCEKYRVEISELNFYQQCRLFGDLKRYGL